VEFDSEVAPKDSDYSSDSEQGFENSVGRMDSVAEKDFVADTDLAVDMDLLTDKYSVGTAVETVAGNVDRTADKKSVVDTTAEIPHFYCEYFSKAKRWSKSKRK